MSSKEKRAKRAKLKAKNARIQKQNSSKDNSRKAHELAPKTLELFKTLPPPVNEAECLSLIQDHLFHNDSNYQFEDIEATKMVLFTLYKRFYDVDLKSL